MDHRSEEANVSELDDDNGAITIYIDRNAFRVPGQAVTGSQLRELAIPPIGADYELFRVSAGSEPDLLVNDLEVVELTPEAQFFSAPRMIMAGSLGTADHLVTRSNGPPLWPAPRQPY